jgi:hypothetical protein
MNQQWHYSMFPRSVKRFGLGCHRIHCTKLVRVWALVWAAQNHGQSELGHQDIRTPDTNDDRVSYPTKNGNVHGAGGQESCIYTRPGCGIISFTVHIKDPIRLSASHTCLTHINRIASLYKNVIDCRPVLVEEHCVGVGSRNTSRRWH